MRSKKGSDAKLKNYKKTFRSETVLLGQVERHVITSTLADTTREQHAIHPSEICDKDACHRQMYYRIVDTPMDLDNIDTSFWRERIFSEGHDIHAKWQTWLWQMGLLYGYWECLVCDYYWYAKSPTVCHKCEAPAKKLRYREVPILNEEHMIVGHADGAVDEGLIEVKSVGLGTVRILAPGFHDRFLNGEWNLQQLWNEIKRPFPTHVRQGMLYSFCKAKLPVHFIYECKWNQAVKEFTVGYSEAIIEPILEACLDIKYAVKKQRPLDRPKWADLEAPACKACPYRKTCWSGEISDQELQRRKPKYRIKVKAA